MIDEEMMARFWAKVDQDGSAVTHVAGVGNCWLWTASGVRGYGRMEVGGRKLRAHRLSWEIHNGPIPTGTCVLHRCDTPACVNPAHLFLGTYLDNARDRDAKGRQAARLGRDNGRAKLTEAKVGEIRKLYATGGVSQKALGKRFGVAKSNIWYIISRKHWPHVA